MRSRHVTIWIGLALALGACDHKPAPARGAPRASGSGSGSAAPAPAPAPAAPAAGSAAVARTPECIEVGVRVAEIVIAGAVDAMAKAQYEQARATTVRTTADACTRGGWDAAQRRCFLEAKTQPDLDTCQRALRPQATRG